MKAPLPSNEEARLKALREYEILDTDPEQAFDDLTRLASQICETPIAVVSLVDSDRQWFKSKLGLDASETSRDVAFCAHTILQTDLFVVPDAQQDMRFSDNPLVTSGPQIRFYAGAPLLTSEDVAVGSLCAIDYVPRNLTPQQQEALEILGRQVVTQIKLRRNIAELEEALRQRQETEQALKAREEQYRSLLDLSSETIAVHIDGKLEYINTAGARLFGAVAPEQLIGKQLLDFVHPDSRAAVAVRQNQVQVNQAVAINQEKLIRLDSQVIDVEMTEVPIIHSGQPATQVMIRDITALKQMKEAMLRATVAELAKQELEKEITGRRQLEESLKEQ
ncbi:PAS domain S-box protein [Gloeocapsopsis crepidinum LEGE 06123]|uniref:PAS domain S-box protein n=1 Tax=Gloeocapsopsis crepidinum LEGE 06123 TaxID=588587 RepID=A0ABR9UV99_9CHRO|nr:GAF domain-containing protein [Gloeocapsopsis crepidinum]MBE9192217.1 PAS domain S-box protein [Gloeocapsopsis crepidinum LEGE 06123]